ncbi:MAG: 50S ribosomal protein L20 [Nitrospirae bacterium]|nr:50S ribosomal protein L20 [Nitrospirota bacterium]
MPRAKGGFKSKRYHKKVLQSSKGYYGARSRLYRIATQVVDKALIAAYKDRRLKKREFRALWIARINAAVRSLDMTYSQFMNGLKKANVNLNRKALAELACSDFETFSKLVAQVAQSK